MSPELVANSFDKAELLVSLESAAETIKQLVIGLAKKAKASS